MKNKKVEPLCICGKRFIEHSEPCIYWHVDIHPERHEMWRRIKWPARDCRNQAMDCVTCSLWIMPVLTPEGIHEFDINLMEIVSLPLNICEESGINFRELDADA